MCDKEIEVIDLTLGSSDEEEDPVLISSDLEDSSAFEYVHPNFAKNIVKVAFVIHAYN
jgi:hypothetical protein